MKILRGKEKLADYKGIPVMVDWDYLTVEVGLRKEEELFERALGKFLIIAVLAFWGLVLGMLALGINLNPTDIINVDSPLALAFWLSPIMLLYGLYLGRDRDIYLDRLVTGELIKLAEKIKAGESLSQIEISKYFDHDLLNLIDDLLVEYEHDFLATLLKDLLDYPNIAYAITRLGLDRDKMQAIIQKVSTMQISHIDNWIKPLLLETFFIAFTNRFEKVDELAMLLHLCKKPLKEILLDFDVQSSEVEALELWLRNEADKQRYSKIFRTKSALKPTSIVNRSYTSSFSPTLIRYSRDFTAEVAKGNFRMSIAREGELAELISQLSEGDARAVLLLGEPGVGKTTLLKSLAIKMVVEEVPEILQDKRLVAFDFNKAYALSRNIEEFEAAVQEVFTETAKTQNVVLVIDNLHELVNIRKEYAAEVVSLMVKSIEENSLRIVATATPDGYSRHIKPFRGLAAVFDTVEMAIPRDNVAVQILMDELPRLEKQHRVGAGFETLVRIVDLAQRYDFERVLPDKAIGLLEETMAQAQEEKLRFVTQDLVEKIVSKKVGTKVGALEAGESEKLMNLEQELHNRLIGQNEAVAAVANALRRARAGLNSGKRPIASFLFFGPTGVGKTELAKAVAAVYYGDEKLMIRVDMSEYQEERNLGRLIGEEVEGEFVGGYLTEALKSKPFSLVLLDEIEKANPKVLDLFLQILDEGIVTDGTGKKVDFTNAIIIATSNVASKDIADSIAQGKAYKDVLTTVMPKLRSFLRVEFLNRFDRVIMFRPLHLTEVEQVVALMLHKEQKLLAQKGIEFSFSTQLVKELAHLGYNPVYGGRELRRVVQDQIEDKLALLIIEKQARSGSKIVFNSLKDVQVQN